MSKSSKHVLCRDIRRCMRAIGQDWVGNSTKSGVEAARGLAHARLPRAATVISPSRSIAPPARCRNIPSTLKKRSGQGLCRQRHPRVAHHRRRRLLYGFGSDNVPVRRSLAPTMIDPKVPVLLPTLAIVAGEHT